MHGPRGPGTIGYDHGDDAEVFYLRLALDERYVEGFVEGCLGRGSGRTTRKGRCC